MHQDQLITVKSILEKMGMEENLSNHVFTSGEASLSYLRKNIILKNFIMLVLQEILIYLKVLKIINQTQ